MEVTSPNNDKPEHNVDAVTGHDYVTKLSCEGQNHMCCVQIDLHEHPMSGKKGERRPISHILCITCSALLQRKVNSFWGLMCRSKQRNHAFHLPRLRSAAGTGFAELHLGRSPVESLVEALVWSSRKSHSKGLG